MIVLEVASGYRLRKPTLQDVAALNEMDAHAEVREHLDMPEPPPMEESQDVIETWLRRYPEGSRRGFWIAEVEGQFAGWLHLRPAYDTGELELGWRFDPAYWGRGLATTGAQALIQLAIEDNEPLVIARTDLANVRSWRVMERLGMTPRREFLYDGRFPAVEYIRQLA